MDRTRDVMVFDDTAKCSPEELWEKMMFDLTTNDQVKPPIYS